jgi:CBS domain containing-hemolysin-like protein
LENELTSLIFILVILLLLSAFFSSAETAFSSVNRIRLRNYEEEGRKGSKRALSVAENFDMALSTILIGNNVVNIAAASISAKVDTDLFGATGLFYSTVLMTILVLIFGEILPKSLAKENAESYSLRIGGVLFLLITVFKPITILFVRLKEVVTKAFKRDDTPSVTEEELKAMVNISQEEGVIELHEKELVYRSLEFDDITAGEILKPRIDIVAVEVKQNIDFIKETFFEERYSRIPVYEDHIDNIIGILSEREFLNSLIREKEVKIRDLLREPVFVVESKKIATLLPQLQKNKVHMAIVIDEFGGTQGLITLEDILEELVGEIWDEHDEKIITYTKLDDNTYEFNGELPLEDVFEILEIDFNKSNFSSHTLGGWIFDELQHIPAKGETLEYGDMEITVHQVEGRRIRKVRMKKTSDKHTIRR